MDIAQITPDLLKQTLRAWQAAEPLPPIWHTCHALPPHQRRPAELSHHLHDLIHTIAQQKLAHYHTAENIPHPAPPTTRTRATADLTADFTPPNSDLCAWSALYHRHLSSIPLTAEEMATAVGLTSRHINRHIERGLMRLAEELQRLEIVAHHNNQTIHRQRHLPPTNHHRLFGVDSLINEVVTWAKDETAHPMLSLEGMGGIGKTTAARAAAHHLATQSHWADIFWVSAQQHDLDLLNGQMRSLPISADIITQLADQMGFAHLAGLSTADKLHHLQLPCRANPYLIIIDNLETLNDLHDLIPHLESLARPTRFLLTSRHAVSQFGFVQTLPIPDLSYEDSYALIQSELGRHKATHPLGAAEMGHIYSTIGGLPLALKLLAAQLGKIPLQTLLANLGNLSQAEIYTYIYRRTWNTLSQPARQLLTCLNDVSVEGADLEWIAYMAQLPTHIFPTALAQLLNCSLLETDGDLHHPHYHLHRLTITFLRTQILDDWDGDDHNEPKSL